MTDWLDVLQWCVLPHQCFNVNIKKTVAGFASCKQSGGSWVCCCMLATTRFSKLGLPYQQAFFPAENMMNN